MADSRRQAGTWFSDDELMERYGLSRENLATLRADPRSRLLHARIREFFELADNVCSGSAYRDRNLLKMPPKPHKPAKDAEKSEQTKKNDNSEPTES